VIIICQNNNLIFAVVIVIFHLGINGMERNSDIYTYIHLHVHTYIHIHMHTYVYTHIYKENALINVNSAVYYIVSALPSHVRKEVPQFLLHKIW
jgi:hypothetical protein